jgi:(p)ppGpp synthase/HD superfamily hydrolase
MLTERFADALALARILHDGQQRKGTPIPYLAHLLAVASLVLEAGAACAEVQLEEAAIGALLHDALEDQGHRITLAELEERYGLLVARIVAECSDAVVTQPGAPKPPWRERKERYLEALAGKAHESLLVASADKLHNMHSIIDEHRVTGQAIWDRFNASRANQVWFFGNFTKCMAAVWPANPLRPRLEHAAAALDALH